MKQLLAQLDASYDRSRLIAGGIRETEESEVDARECQELRRLGYFIRGLREPSLVRAWQEVLLKTLPPGKHHQHTHRIDMLEALHRRLSEPRQSPFDVQPQVLESLRLQVLDMLETFKRNDALHDAKPAP